MATRRTRMTTRRSVSVNLTPFASSWIVMLALGALHHEVSAKVPAVSYWLTFLVIIALHIVVAIFRRR